MPRRIGVVVAAVAVAFALPLNAGAQLATPAHHPTPHHPRTSCRSSSCVQRVAAKRCSQSQVEPCIHRAALRWRVSYSMLMRKARCESRLDPLAVNGSHKGVFQFDWNPETGGTWGTTPYASRSPWRAKWNALAAAWMHHVGRGGEWQCQ